MKTVEVTEQYREEHAEKDMQLVADRIATAVQDVLARDERLARSDGMLDALWHKAATGAVASIYRTLFAPYLENTTWYEPAHALQGPLVAALWAWIEGSFKGAGLGETELLFLRRYLLGVFEDMLAHGIEVRIEAVLGGPSEKRSS